MISRSSAMRSAFPACFSRGASTTKPFRANWTRMPVAQRRNRWLAATTPGSRPKSPYRGCSARSGARRAVRPQSELVQFLHQLPAATSSPSADTLATCSMTTRPIHAEELRDLCLRHPQRVARVADVEPQTALCREDEKAVAGFILDEIHGFVVACAHLFARSSQENIIATKCLVGEVSDASSREARLRSARVSPGSASAPRCRRSTARRRRNRRSGSGAARVSARRW